MSRTTIIKILKGSIMSFEGCVNHVTRMRVFPHPYLLRFGLTLQRGCSINDFLGFLLSIILSRERHCFKILNKIFRFVNQICHVLFKASQTAIVRLWIYILQLKVHFILSFLRSGIIGFQIIRNWIMRKPPKILIEI